MKQLSDAQNIVELGCRLAEQGTKSFLIVTPDQRTAEQLRAALLFFAGGKLNSAQIAIFTGWEILPYEQASPYEKVISERLRILAQLLQRQLRIVLVDVATLLYRLPPRQFIAQTTLSLRRGETLDPIAFSATLIDAGYLRVRQVTMPGEFSCRGSILDIFPTGGTIAYRIELFDNEIESLRTFAVETQCSLQQMAEIQILPAKEFSLNERSVALFSEQWRDNFANDLAQTDLGKKLLNGTIPSGIEYYETLFFNESATLFDYLTPDFTTLLIGDLTTVVQTFMQMVTTRYELLRYDTARPILSPERILYSWDEIKKQAQNCTQAVITTAPQFQLTEELFSAAATFNQKINQLKNWLQQGVHVLLIAHSVGTRETLLNLLHEQQLMPFLVDNWSAFLTNKNNLAICVQPFVVSGTLTDDLRLVSDLQLLESGSIAVVTRNEQKQLAALLAGLEELQPGDPLVHLNYGVGRYIGLQKIAHDQITEEFLVLGYADENKLYVPVTSLDLISRYRGINNEVIPLDHLGSTRWLQHKRKALQKVQDVAAELLTIYAQRQLGKKLKFRLDHTEYQRFAAEFPFIPTPDQQKAIDETLAEMQSDQLMDRLICGDVGFGKTEIAMRAAFLAIQSGYQVAVLTPTTILAQQHYESFCERFAAWPVKIGLITRLNAGKAQNELLKKLADGTLDLVIGTHLLLQTRIKFGNLGLLIIDEEHRFGVKQKEQLKQLVANVDILSLTATPIPRTLSLAFADLRHFSIIATPPAKRLAIKTFLRQHDPQLIREAILRELMRGGQIYYLHNDIQTLPGVAHELQQLLPQLKLAIAHGQMPKQQLAHVMRAFYRRQIDLLLCTTIIESGLDVANANTIIIDRADRLGLAQLYQLRGRVGRSHHQAYAYLLVPELRSLSPDAQKRFAALQSLKDLGTGFSLAMHDLEIRGAGEILGEKQSGVIDGIGFNLYMEMLERAVSFLKRGEKVDTAALEVTPLEVNLPFVTLIPDDYIAAVNTRLVFYQRIAGAEEKELDQIAAEMIDRFGQLPEACQNLFQLARLKLLARKLQLARLIWLERGTLQFLPTAHLDVTKLITVLHKYCDNFKFLDQYSLELVAHKQVVINFEFLFELLNAILQQLTQG